MKSQQRNPVVKHIVTALLLSLTCSIGGCGHATTTGEPKSYPESALGPDMGDENCPWVKFSGKYYRSDPETHAYVTGECQKALPCCTDMTYFRTDISHVAGRCFPDVACFCKSAEASGVFTVREPPPECRRARAISSVQ